MAAARKKPDTFVRASAARDTKNDERNAQSSRRIAEQQAYIDTLPPTENEEAEKVRAAMVSSGPNDVYGNEGWSQLMPNQDANGNWYSCDTCVRINEDDEEEPVKLQQNGSAHCCPVCGKSFTIR